MAGRPILFICYSKNIEVVLCRLVINVVVATFILESRQEVDPKLLVPVFDRLFPFFPEKWRYHLRFGIVYSKEDPESCIDTKVNTCVARSSR